MDYVTLGRTGLRVSAMGLGCGGHSRLGLAIGKTEADAEEVVRQAISLGINFIDTAESYGTESVVGKALHGIPRERVVLSTKAGVQWQGRRATGEELAQRVKASLSRLQTDYIDVFHLHGVSPNDYPYAYEELLPTLRTLQSAGLIRFTGITEQFIADTTHAMLAQAMNDNAWDVMMVGFSILNQTARATVFPRTRQLGVGTLCMFAVRRALSRPEALRELIRDLCAQGKVNRGRFRLKDPLGFVFEESDATSVTECAYRFCRWEPGNEVILSGTGNVEHLRLNAAAINAPPLPPVVVEKLKTLFARVDNVSGN